MRSKQWMIRWVGSLWLALVELVLSTNADFAHQAYKHAWYSVDEESVDEESVDEESTANSANDSGLRGVAGQAGARAPSRNAYNLAGEVPAAAGVPAIAER